MFLRVLLLLVVLANGAYYLWSHGHLAELGHAPAQQREPQRLAAQIKPGLVRVLPADETRRLEQQLVRPPECLMSGLVDGARIAALKAGMTGLLDGAPWAIEPLREEGRWIVYMGKYPNADALTKKKGELRQLGLVFESVRRADLEPGLALAAGATRGEADQLLAGLVRRGARTARVIEEKPAVSGERLRLPVADDAVKAKLAEVRALGGIAALGPCKP